MKKKSKYIRPEVEIEYSYDLETELMYGGHPFYGNGGTSGMIVGSHGSGGSGGGSSVDPNISGTDDEDSDLAKGGVFIWDDFEFHI